MEDRFSPSTSRLDLAAAMSEALAETAANRGDGAVVQGAEESLIRRARRGDLAAFEALVHTYQGRVFKVCHAMVDDQQTSEDLVQDTLLQAWKRLPSLRRPGSFRPWLLRIARNRCRDHWRRSGGPISKGIEYEDVSRGLPAARDPELPRLLEEALSRLSSGQSEVFRLHEFAGLSHEEVAEIRGTSVGTSRALLRQAREALRQSPRLKDYKL